MGLEVRGGLSEWRSSASAEGLPGRPRQIIRRRRGDRRRQGQSHRQVRRDHRGRAQPRRRSAPRRPDGARRRVAAQGHRQGRPRRGVRQGDKADEASES